MADSINIRPFIEEQEGGLSRAKTDTASKLTAPWTYKGYNDWHTNAGVTYESFIGLAPILKYAITPDNFFLMPDKIWGAIFKRGYWDQLELDNIKSQVIADTILTWAWGSGVTGAYKQLQKFLLKKGITVNSKKQVDDAFNNLVNVFNEKQIFLELCEARKAFFISINQPANLKGWLNRLEKFKTFGLNTIVKKKLKIITVALILIVIIGAIGTFYYKQKD